MIIFYYRISKKKAEKFNWKESVPCVLFDATQFHLQCHQQKFRGNAGTTVKFHGERRKKSWETSANTNRLKLNEL